MNLIVAELFGKYQMVGDSDYDLGISRQLKLLYLQQIVEELEKND